ncbi:MAG: efflux RND transporter periplasmic adaptor subunit [Proteobacteria bacterium]|nr:efflux RND transporter periplasmic adaptor subunit [Pseudomonadota bacterium]
MLQKAAFLFFLSAFGAPALAQPEFQVTTSELDDRKAVFGTVQSVDVVAARARIGGTTRELAVDEGSAVTAGEVIATIEDPKLGLRMASLDARIRALDAQRKLAQTELNRMRKLRTSGTISQARLDEAQTNLNVVTGNRAAIVAERAVLEQQMSEGAVLAPAVGRVLRVHVTEGSVIMPGEPVAVIAAERYVLRIELPERHARFVREGDEVLIGERGLAPGDPDSQRKGTIIQVYPEMSQGRVIADVEAAGLGDYFVGARTRVHVATGKRKTILVPAGYLRQRYGVAFVTVKDEGEVMVQPGQRLGDQVEILSGLKPGDILLQH